MLPDQVSNPGPLTYESGALPIALCPPPPSQTTTKNLYHSVWKEKLILQQNYPRLRYFWLFWRQKALSYSQKNICSN